jgi:serine/threonine protein kinase
MCGTTGTNNKNIYIIAGVVSGTIVLMATIIIYVIWRRRKGLHRYVKLADASSWTTIEDIEIHEQLGGGNYGDVYRGTWNGTTTVALKKLKDKSMFVSFASEASMLQTLKHPNVVQFLGIYSNSDSGDQYIVTEYLSLGSLDVLVMKQKRTLTVLDLLAM